MLPCKNRLFKKLLLFSFIFLIFSLFCNKFIYADDVSNERLEDSTKHVKIQQIEIISSLKKIEGCLEKRQGLQNVTR